MATDVGAKLKLGKEILQFGDMGKTLIKPLPEGAKTAEDLEEFFFYEVPVASTSLKTKEGDK